jgi:peroxiredoxin 5
MVKDGDSIPNIALVENAPGNKVELSKELASGKGLIIGVPAAFSMSYSFQTELASFDQIC